MDIQLVSIGIGVAALGAAALLKTVALFKARSKNNKKSTQVSDAFHRRIPTEHKPWLDKDIKPSVNPPAIAESEPEDDYPPGPDAVDQAPQEPAHRDSDPKALWNFDIAYRTKHIDFSRYQKPTKFNFDEGPVRPEKLHNHIVQLPDEDFIGEVTGDAQNNASVLYLCDSKGFVHDVCISALDANNDWITISYSKGAFKDGEVFVVQVADGLGLWVTYHPLDNK